MAGEEVTPGVILAGERALPEDLEVQGPVWIGHDVSIGAGVRLMGPVVLGDGARVGERAQLRESIVFPGTVLAEESILIGAIAGHGGILASMTAAYLLLEDGIRFEGELCGHPRAVTGEVVFNTAMTGYQEAVTDPSYAGQIITFTYPLIGNYGVSAAAMESERIHVRGAITNGCTKPI